MKPESPSFYHTILPVGALLASAAFLVMGNGLQQMLLPIRAQIEGFDTVQIGAMGSGYFLGFVLGCLTAPRLILIAGHVRTFAALVSIASAAALFHPIVIEPLSWFIFRILTGFCLSGLLLVMESWLNERATNETRGRVMSAYVTINFSMITVGQLLVAIMEPASFVLFSVASVLLSLAAVPILLSRSPQPSPIRIVRFRPKALFAISHAGVAGALLIGMVNGTVFALGPLFAKTVSGSVDFAAYFMCAVVIGAAIGQWPVGMLSDRFDRRRVMIGIAASSAAVSALFLLLSPPLVGLLVLGFFFGMATYTAYPVAAAHTFDFTAKENMVETSSGLLLVFGIGSTIGPLIASSAMWAFGPASLFAYVISAQSALILFVAYRMLRRDAPGADERSAFSISETAPIPGISVDVSQENRESRHASV